MLLPSNFVRHREYPTLVKWIMDPLTNPQPEPFKLSTIDNVPIVVDFVQGTLTEHNTVRRIPSYLFPSSQHKELFSCEPLPHMEGPVRSISYDPDLITGKTSVLRNLVMVGSRVLAPNKEGSTIYELDSERYNAHLARYLKQAIRRRLLFNYNVKRALRSYTPIIDPHLFSCYTEWPSLFKEEEDLEKDKLLTDLISDLAKIEPPSLVWISDIVEECEKIIPTLDKI